MAWGTSDGAPPKVVANLSNAHPPSIPMSNAALGYVEDAVAGSVYYGAMAVAKGAVSAVSDKWSVHLVDLRSGAVLEAALDPQPSVLGAETTSLSGFGLLLA